MASIRTSNILAAGDRSEIGRYEEDLSDGLFAYWVSVMELFY